MSLCLSLVSSFICFYLFSNDDLKLLLCVMFGGFFISFSFTFFGYSVILLLSVIYSTHLSFPLFYILINTSLRSFLFSPFLISSIIHLHIYYTRHIFLSIFFFYFYSLCSISFGFSAFVFTILMVRNNHVRSLVEFSLLWLFSSKLLLFVDI